MDYLWIVAICVVTALVVMRQIVSRKENSKSLPPLIAAPSAKAQGDLLEALIARKADGKRLSETIPIGADASGLRPFLAGAQPSPNDDGESEYVVILMKFDESDETLNAHVVVAGEPPRVVRRWISKEYLP
jgi:hypothetical protein